MSKKPDIINQFLGKSWIYSKNVRKHFFAPKNFLSDDSKTGSFDVEGIVGSPACGDVMRIWLKIDKKNDRIKDFKWRTFGCASAIAATSMLSVMATEKNGMKLDRAMAIKPRDITKRLGGLPDRKIHCSVLGDKALRNAINNWFKKTEQYDRIIVEGSKIIDQNTKVTEVDIEAAVIDGARTVEDVQKMTKVGVGNPDCLPEVEQLVRFYVEKYSKK